MILAFDIGGSFIKPGLSRGPDHLDILPRQPTPGDDYDAFVAVIASVLAGLAEQPQAIAISLTGVVDPGTQELTCANIPSIHRRRLGPALEAEFGLPVLIANDAECFVLAEAAQGAGRGHDIVFGIILGSGVGGGLVSHGRLINQSGGFAGEWGHGPILPLTLGDPAVTIPAFACGCGHKGCLNTVGAARGVELLHAHLHGVTASSEAIVRNWEEGELQAARTVEILTDIQAYALALAINISGAAIAPAGGGLANSSKLLSILDYKTKLRTLRRFDGPLIVKSECGPEAGLIGAAVLGWSMR
jgi:N-acetylglucosamine kinase